MLSSKTRCLGILTAGGDSPGLNAVVRAITKVAMNEFGMRVLGIQDGFRGLVENRILTLDDATVSGVLTRGGTILGTSRDKPHSMPMGGKLLDMTGAAVENTRKHQMDCVVCLGGGGTAKNAYRLMQKGGLNVMTLPKTIDNDVFGTDVSFGFDTAVSIATEAIDRLHTTATSHHRLIVCEVMGHRAGWLALHSGIAGGADVILIPELPYDLEKVADFLLERRRHGKRFSIIAVAEGAMSQREAAEAAVTKSKDKERKKAKEQAKLEKGELPTETNGEDEAVDAYRADLPVNVQRLHDETMAYHVVQEPMASRLARHLQALTGVEARVTSLGHVQRGGIPTAFDRTLSTMMGAKAAELLAEGTYNVMVAYRNGLCVPVPLQDVVGQRKLVPADHHLIHSARQVGTCFGD
ncbi:MAG: ATP-dependent 6-phosphofructokinase [Holophaga sp.]|nr:ATP-dependent 6-phosphofructokinase [Holophaga sp.]